MTARIRITMVALVVLAGVLLGCAGPAATPTPTPAAPTTAAPTPTPAAPTTSAKPTTAAPTPTPAAKVITLKLTTFRPPADDSFAASLKYFATEAEKRTNGRFKVEIYWSEVLAKAMETVGAVKAGTAELGHFVSSYYIDIFPYFGGTQNMAFAGGEPADFYVGITAKAFKAYQQLGSQYPEVSAEMSRQNLQLLASMGYPNEALWLTKPIASIADLKGLKARVTGRQKIEFFSKTMGIVAVSMPASDVHDGLSRGLLQGTCGTGSASSAYKFYEAAKFVYAMPSSLFRADGLTYGIAMNQNTWKSLPADIQQVFLQIGADSMNVYDTTALKEIATFDEQFKKAGVSSYQMPLTPEQLESWKVLAYQIFFDGYVKELEGKGQPKAREILSKYRALVYGDKS